MLQGSKDLTTQQNKRLAKLRDIERNIGHKFSRLEDRQNMPLKKPRTISPKKPEVVAAEDSDGAMDSDCDLPSPGYVPMKNHRDATTDCDKNTDCDETACAEDSGVAEEAKKLTGDIEDVEAEKKEILSVKPQLRTKEQKKKLQALYKEVPCHSLGRHENNVQLLPV